MRKNIIGRFLAQALIVVAIVGAGVVATATPSMAATCNWDTCTDKDPQATGCSSTAQNFDSRYVSNGSTGTYYTIDLRNGYNCTAVWARITLDTCLGLYGGDDWYIDIEETIATPYGYYPTANGTANNPSASCDGGRVWSYMRQFDHANVNNKYNVCWEHRTHGSAAPGRYEMLSTHSASSCLYNKSDTSQWRHF